MSEPNYVLGEFAYPSERELATGLRDIAKAGQDIRDAVERARPWYRRCAFCPHTAERGHEEGCLWVLYLGPSSVLDDETLARHFLDSINYVSNAADAEARLVLLIRSVRTRARR